MRGAGMKSFRIQNRIDIDRPAAQVFDFVADQTNAPRWQKGLHKVRRVTPGPIGVGTEHVIARRFAGMKIDVRNRYTAYDAGRFVSFEIPSGKISGQASYLVEPTGTNTSRVISEVDFRVSGLAGLATPLLTRVFDHDSRKDMNALKAVLEHGGD
jgi:uncharacterized membrane protein